MMRFGGYGHGFNLIGLGIACFMMLVFIALVVLGIIALVRYYKRNDHHTVQLPGNSALNILNERYAKGEVSEEEYKRMKALLKE